MITETHFQEMTDAEFRLAMLAGLAEVKALLSEPKQLPMMLTNEQTMRRINKSSLDAMYRWLNKWKIPSDGTGRHSRLKIDLALARESGAVHAPVSMRRAS